MILYSIVYHTTKSFLYTDESTMPKSMNLLRWLILCFLFSSLVFVESFIAGDRIRPYHYEPLASFLSLNHKHSLHSPSTISSHHLHGNQPNKALYPRRRSACIHNTRVVNSRVQPIRAKSLYEITLFDEEFLDEDELPVELDEDLKHFNDTFITKPFSRMKFSEKETMIRHFLSRLISQELRYHQDVLSQYVVKNKRK